MAPVARPRLLVIGGTGFIGKHILRQGLKKDFQITCISKSQVSADLVLELRGVNFIRADIADISQLNQIRGISYDYVVNLGGYINHDIYSECGRNIIDAHLNGILNLLDILNIKTIKRFIQIGSSDEYGDAPSPQAEEYRESPISPYAYSKTAATHFLQMLARTENFPAIILRLFLVYGPGQDIKRFIPQVISGCLRNEQFPLSPGQQLRDFCYVDDVVRAIYKCFEVEMKPGTLLNIASGKPRSLKAVVEEISIIIGAGKPIFGELPYRNLESMSLFADISLAKSILGWKPQIEFEEGLRNTVKAIAGGSDV